MTSTLVIKRIAHDWPPAGLTQGCGIAPTLGQVGVI